MKLPDMHRSGLEAEWHSIPKELWNDDQIFADKHGEWATRATLATAIGAVTTGAGLVLMSMDTSKAAIAGVIAIGIGRSLDIVDGKLAAMYGVKSPTGEKIDAGTDTVLIIASLATLMANGTFPIGQGIATAAVTAAKMGFTGIAERRRNEIHTSRAGKLGTLGLWGAVGAYSIAKVADVMNKTGMQQASHTTGNIILGAGLVLSAKAAYDYSKSAFPKKLKTTKA